MSVNDLADTLEAIALEALFHANALESCQFHPEVTIRIGDPDADKHAYALATNILKRRDAMFLREDLMDTVKDSLDMAADGECPQCTYLRDQ